MVLDIRKATEELISHDFLYYKVHKNYSTENIHTVVHEEYVSTTAISRNFIIEYF